MIRPCFLFLAIFLLISPTFSLNLQGNTKTRSKKNSKSPEFQTPQKPRVSERLVPNPVNRRIVQAVQDDVNNLKKSLKILNISKDKMSKMIQSMIHSKCSVVSNHIEKTGFDSYKMTCGIEVIFADSHLDVQVKRTVVTSKLYKFNEDENFQIHFCDHIFDRAFDCKYIPEKNTIMDIDAHNMRFKKFEKEHHFDENHQDDHRMTFEDFKQNYLPIFILISGIIIIMIFILLVVKYRTWTIILKVLKRRMGKKKKEF